MRQRADAPHKRRDPQQDGDKFAGSPGFRKMVIGFGTGCGVGAAWVKVSLAFGLWRPLASFSRERGLAASTSGGVAFAEFSSRPLRKHLLLDVVREASLPFLSFWRSTLLIGLGWWF
eukprot:scaffold657_cov245-Pinguiococcus_pyrenoidosus.AAC.10